MKISKLMYYADKLHLNRFGRPISGDAYIRMKFGPVPSMGLNLMRHTAYFEDTSELFDQKITVKGLEVTPRQEVDISVFSRSDLDAMDEVMKNFGAISASFLSDLSHGEDAWNKAEMNRKIDFELLFDKNPDSQHLLNLLIADAEPSRSAPPGLEYTGSIR